MFITCPSERYRIAEEVQMALEGGCKWIQLAMDGATDEEFRQTALEVIPMCKEHEAYLVFQDRVALAMEMGVHGMVLVRDNTNPLVVRENMGAEAIIGTASAGADGILRYKGMDVDYVEIGPCSAKGADGALTPAACKAVVDRVRGADMLLPVVAAGDIPADDVPAYLAAGVNGIAVSHTIAGAPDPVAATRGILAKKK